MCMKNHEKPCIELNLNYNPLFHTIVGKSKRNIFTTTTNITVKHTEPYCFTMMIINVYYAAKIFQVKCMLILICVCMCVCMYPDVTKKFY